MQILKRQKLAGFTLIELMIVVAIIALIAAIGYPAYGNYVIRGKRSEGRAALLDAAAINERNFSDNNQYTDPADYMTENSHYQIATTLANSNTTFTIRATPQFTDGDCGYLEITQAGEKSAELGTVAECWGR